MLTSATQVRITDANERRLPWIQITKGAPYFVTEYGDPWMPIGQNDSVAWPDLAGLYGRRDLPTAEAYLAQLADHGVTCLRLMLEYSEGGQRYFEAPAGHFNPVMVQFWDDLFSLCEKYGLRILLTPFDTFWMWIRWGDHPYNKKNGGPCEDRARLMISPETRQAIKRRLAFATERWGNSGVLFAWDLWNEIHPAYASDDARYFAEFVDDVGDYLRELEIRLHGRAHPQTVSVFGPLIAEGFFPQIYTVFTPVVIRDPRVAECVYRHPKLDFASAHFYEEGTIDDPHNTVDAATSAGKLVREALVHIQDNRPFLESEHGPIHAFKDRHETLPATFDEEYFRHIQWAEIAAGAAGGGMRWPNRRPHSLTLGMHEAQAALARFLPLIDWSRFERRNWNAEIQISPSDVRCCACGDSEQAILWLVRTDQIGAEGTLRPDVAGLTPRVRLPKMRKGRYMITAWDTRSGRAQAQFELVHLTDDGFEFQAPPITTDLAFAIRRVG